MSENMGGVNLPMVSGAREFLSSNHFSDMVLRSLTLRIEIRFYKACIVIRAQKTCINTDCIYTDVNIY